MDVSEDLSTLSTEGYLVLKDVFSKDNIDRYKKEVFDQLKIIDGKNYPYPKRFITSLEFKNSFLEEDFYYNYFTTSIIRKALGNDFVIESFLMPITNGSSQNQRIHSDGGILFNDKLNMVQPAHAIGLLIPLIDMDINTGTTRIFPQTHKEFPYKVKEKKEYIDPELSIGDCILMDTRTFHYGTDNKSNQTRPLLYLTYSRPWYMNSIDFRFFENFRMSDASFNAIVEGHKHLFVRRNIKT